MQTLHAKSSNAINFVDMDNALYIIQNVYSINKLNYGLSKLYLYLKNSDTFSTYEHQVLSIENAFHLMIKSAYWGMSLRQQKYKSYCAL